ncbi:MAG: MFS transporter, partial [Bacteroidota bacterium]
MSSVAQKQIPLKYKVYFGLGMLANQMFPAAMAILMAMLVSVFGFPPWMWSICFFIPRLLDAFTDPVMGFISDNTKSKWGRRRQSVVVG